GGPLLVRQAVAGPDFDGGSVAGVEGVDVEAALGGEVLQGAVGEEPLLVGSAGAALDGDGRAVVESAVGVALRGEAHRRGDHLAGGSGVPELLLGAPVAVGL